MSLPTLPRLAAGVFVFFACCSAGSAAEQAVVLGVASYREPIAVPTEAVLEVILEDVGVADGPAIALARSVRTDAGQPPYRFQMAYDPARIDPTRRYGVRARLSVGGRLEFASDTLQSALTGDAASPVDVVMMRVADEHVGGPEAPPRRRLTQTAPETVPAAAVAEATPALKGIVTYMAEKARFTDCRSGREYPVADDAEYEALVHAYLATGREPGAPIMVSFEGGIETRPQGGGGDEQEMVVVQRFVGVWPDQTCEQALGNATLKNTVWLVERLGETELAADAMDRKPQLLLDGAKGTFNATVGCNQLVGGFEQEEQSLSFGTGATTTMACPAPLAAWEREFAEILARTGAWRIEGDALELLDSAGAPIAWFRALYRY